MYSRIASKNYAAVQISTVDRGRLLLMMYDGAIKFLNHAKDGLSNKDIPKFARFLSKAQAIIAELMNTLDFEAGGQIAKDLDRLYDFMLYYLTEANLQKDTDKIQRVIGLLEIIAGAYREIIEGKDTQALVAAAEAAKEKAREAASGDKQAPVVGLTKPTPSNGTTADQEQPLPGRSLRISL